MNLVLPSVLEAKVSPGQAKLDFAVGLYSGGRVTMGMAADVAGVTIPDFQRELGHRGIPVHYTAEDLAYDLQAVEDLARR